MGSYPSNFKQVGGQNRSKMYGGASRKTRQSPLGLVLVVLIVGVLAFYWYNNIKGNIIFLQSIGATEVSRGYDFGPIFLKRNVYYRSEITLTVPKTTDWWVISTQQLNSNKQLMTSDIRMLAPGISPKVQAGKKWTESKVFKQGFIDIKQDFVDQGFFYLNVKQTEGVALLQQSTHPVVRLLIKEDVGIPWVGYLILVLTFVVALFILFRQSIFK